MKRLILMVVVTATAFVQNTFAQNNESQSLQATITAYLNVKNALTKDKADSVSAYAKALSSALYKVPMEKLDAGQYKIWLKYYDGLKKSADNLGNSTDLKVQRKHFGEISKKFYEMLKAMKINTTDLFYQYCPMADAYWISENSKIANPYYGKQMSSCGSTKETLKKNK